MNNGNGPLYATGGAHPHALERNQDAMTGLATGKKIVRPQEILTPQSVVDFCKALWGIEYVRLDPCAPIEDIGLVKAAYEYRGTRPEDDGLLQPWLDCTYVNPPYKDLRKWMKKASEEAKHGHRIVMLAPTRGHRQWWHDYRDTCSCVIELAPLKFAGYEQAFPAPLSLLIWNTTAVDPVVALKLTGLKYTKVTYL